MLRFAVLRHDSPRRLHFDFLLEMGEVLKTWALPCAPDRSAEMTCEALPDHRPAYLDYEGPIGGDRGTVARWDWGTYQIQQQSSTELVVDLCGGKLAGRAALRELPERPGHWRFTFAAHPLST